MPMGILYSTPECNLISRDVSGLLDQLTTYHAYFVPAFAHADQREHSEMYLRGLFSTCERTSIEPMALHLGVSIRPLQDFISQSTLSIDPIIAQHQLLVGLTLAEEDGAFLIDECSVVKQDHDSVGFALRYCASIGKVTNSQLGVYLGYVSCKGYTRLIVSCFFPRCGLARRTPTNASRPGCRRRLSAKQSLRLHANCCDGHWRLATFVVAGWRLMCCMVPARPFATV